MTGETLSGRVATGVGQGRHFTRLDWARRQFVDKLGIDPYPGTFNVVIDDPDAITVWVRLKRTNGIVIENPNDGPYDCDGKCWKVTLDGGIAGAIVLPEMSDYPPAQLEIIAGIGLRDALSVEDGDQVKLVIDATR